MLNAQRRHQPPCKRPMFDKGYTKCTCPIVIRGTLNGKFLSLSTAKFLPADQARDLKAARDIALLWERTGEPIRPEHTAPVAATEPAAEPDRPTVEMAIAAFMADSRDRGNGRETLHKKRVVFESPRVSSLKRFCFEKGIRFLTELDLNAVREWRASWNLNSSLSRSKRQDQVMGFFWFCERAGWMPRNFASDITRGLGRIQVKATQTGYFDPDQYKAIMDVTYAYVDGPGNRPDGSPRLRALTEVMRWTGLRISDAVTLRRDRLSIDEATGIWSVILYQKKTGDPIYCPIPPDVAELLLSLKATQKNNTNDTYFFWTGNGGVRPVVSNWRRVYGRIFDMAKIKTADGAPKRCHPHMFRDTFAVEALLSGMRLEEVSIILGHSSIRITERHYMPWVRARQNSLNRSVIESWEKQGKVKMSTPRKPKLVRMPIAV